MDFSPQALKSLPNYFSLYFYLFHFIYETICNTKITAHIDELKKVKNTNKNI